MKRKGFTLVEVLVAMAVFLISFAVITATYVLSTKGEFRQREYIHFETICLDIDEYSDKFKRDWVSRYYNEEISAAVKNLDSFIIYYDKDYSPILDKAKATYKMELSYGDYTKEAEGEAALLELKLSVIHIEENRFIIEDLIYGSRGGRYEKQ